MGFIAELKRRNVFRVGIASIRKQRPPVLNQPDAAFDLVQTL